MDIFVFDVRGSIGHFRRPDTLATHATYPFITRTALHGLVAAILGRKQLPESPRCGVELVAPVATVSQEMSLLGKVWVGGGKTFNRPTAIELVVQPHYRIYYSGCLCEELRQAVCARRSYYHTYLGSAFCLTYPEPIVFFSASDVVEIVPSDGDSIESVTVVPSFVVERLNPVEDRQYARVSGVVYEHLGDRRFQGAVSLLYEVHGRPVRFEPSPDLAKDDRVAFRQLPDRKVVTLW